MYGTKNLMGRQLGKKSLKNYGWRAMIKRWLLHSGLTCTQRHQPSFCSGHACFCMGKKVILIV